MVVGKINNEQRYTYLSTLANKVEALLHPFYESNTIDEVMESLPIGLNSSQLDIIRTRWPYFYVM